MKKFISVPIHSDKDIVSARQEGRATALTLGFSETESTLIATAISELARNIVTYAKRGEVQIRSLNNSSHEGIEVTARDCGPGIANVRMALQDGFSTSGSLGLGLPGVKRLVDEFHIVSGVDGTTVTIKKWKP
ncbi:MAG TPA: anti-sigma regulatory factor [Terriglobales bacterium]|jgi:serine/threonine-protein kinase RsbT|nr:anti-sigma regulatory factor [Terriglobales bacterium]